MSFGEARISADPIEQSDFLRGDYVFEFLITTTPLARSLKVLVSWVDNGFAVFYGEGEEE